jgi:hypothetical protein
MQKWQLLFVNVYKCKSLISAGAQFETRMKMGQAHHCSQGLYNGTWVDFLYGVFVFGCNLMLS